MPVNLRNYTSTVPVGRSVQMIEEILVKAGASHIAKWWEKEKLAGVIFQMPVNNLPMTFKLPAEPDSVEKIMLEGVLRPRRGTVERVKDQALRTSWKLLYDWVSVQVTMIKMGQAKAIQVFLPYVYDEVRNETFFERLESQGFKQLTAGKPKEGA